MKPWKEVWASEKRKLFFEEVFNELKDYIQPKVLDIGCGPGLFLKVLEENGISGYGIEKDKELVDYGNQLLKKNKIILGDAREVEISANTVTLLGNTLPYFSYEELERLLKKAKNVKYFILEFRGTFWILEHLLHGKEIPWEFVKFVPETRQMIMRVDDEEFPVSLYDEYIVSLILERCGFRLVDKKVIKKTNLYIWGRECED